MIEQVTAETIATALHGRKSGAGWSCKCPAHKDRSPSLSVTERDGKVLVHCFAGCSQSDVVTALKGRGLWPESSLTPPQKRDFRKQRQGDEVDLAQARSFGDAVHILTEQALEVMSPVDPQRTQLTALLVALRSDTALLAEYRSWRSTHAGLTGALVAAGRKHRRRVKAMLEGYLEAMVYAA